MNQRVENSKQIAGNQGNSSEQWLHKTKGARQFVLFAGPKNEKCAVLHPFFDIGRQIYCEHVLAVFCDQIDWRFICLIQKIILVQTVNNT